MHTLRNQVILRLLLLPPVIWLLLLLPAGSFNFWEVYLYFGIVIVFGLYANFYFSKHDPELLKRRMNSKETEPAQKIAIAIITAAMIVVYLIAGFDRKNGWSELSIWTELFGFLLVVIGYYLTFQVLKTNSFAARTVGIEEGQELVDSGLYGLVRHPMYSGFMTAFLGTPLALGSWWGLVPIIVMLAGFGIRILNEEKLLQANLTGYKEYCQRVRWRLLPGVW